MKVMIISAAALLLTACVIHNEKQQTIGMANPASVYCEKIGGESHIVKESGNEVRYCILPGGESINEWTLYRRDHQQGE